MRWRHSPPLAPKSRESKTSVTMAASAKAAGTGLQIHFLHGTEAEGHGGVLIRAARGRLSPRPGIVIRCPARTDPLGTGQTAEPRTACHVQADRAHPGCDSGHSLPAGHIQGAVATITGRGRLQETDRLSGVGDIDLDRLRGCVFDRDSHPILMGMLSGGRDMALAIRDRLAPLGLAMGLPVAPAESLRHRSGPP